MVNIVSECRDIHVYFNGTRVCGNIIAVNVPDVERNEKRLDVELKWRSIQPDALNVVAKTFGVRNTQLKIQASIEDNYGALVQASWTFRGLPRNIPTSLMPATLNFNAHFYEHIIDGQEKYYIDIFEGIYTIDGVDQNAAVREVLGM